MALDLEVPESNMVNISRSQMQAITDYDEFA
jgi:hypothetical protein